MVCQRRQVTRRSVVHSAVCFALAMLVAATCSLCGTSVQAGAGAPSVEYQVKAVFLYNFAKFVEWPEAVFSGPDAPIVIGVVGESPFGTALELAVKGETVKGRKLLLKQFSSEDSLTSCHILFISRSERERIPALLEKLGKAPVLTVADSEGFTTRGGMINFVLQEKNIRFDIDPGAAERAGLKISSRLLNLPKPARSDPAREVN